MLAGVVPADSCPARRRLGISGSFHRSTRSTEPTWGVVRTSRLTSAKTLKETIAHHLRSTPHSL